MTERIAPSVTAEIRFVALRLLKVEDSTSVSAEYVKVVMVFMVSPEKLKL